MAYRLPTPEQWRDLAQDAAKAVADLRRHGPDLIELAALAGKDFPADLRRDGGGHTKPGATGGRTAALALAERPDPLEADAKLVRDAATVMGLLIALGERAASLRAEPAASVEAAGAGECHACGRHCSGSRVDRLRAGYCDAHYRRWLRAGRPDRLRYAAEIAAEVAAEAVAGRRAA